jgi:hypothetical protein
MIMSVIKKTLLHLVGLLGVAILAGIASGLIAGLVGGDPAAVAEWCAWAYLALVVLLPLGLWMVVVVFFDQDRNLYEEWGPTLVVTLVPAILGALAARIAFVGPATTAAAIINPQFDPGELAMVMAAHFGWAVILPVLIATVVGALLIAVWAKRRGSTLPGLHGGL